MHLELFNQGQPGTWMSIFVEDVDALHDAFQKSGATITRLPEDLILTHKSLFG